MKFDVTRLFDDSDVPEEVGTGEGTLAGEDDNGTLAGEGSSLGLGTLLLTNKGEEGINFTFQLSKQFVPKNYSFVGISPVQIDEGADYYKLWGRSVENYNGSATNMPSLIFTQDELECDANKYFEKQGYDERFELKLNYFYVYAGAVDNNGKVWQIGNGEKIRFRFEKANLKQVNAYKDTVVVRVNKTEQAISSENYSAVAVTFSFQGDSIYGNSLAGAKYVEKTIDFESRNSTTNFILYGVPSGEEFTVYLYKKTVHGKYYFMGSCDCQAYTEVEEEENKPSCLLDVEFENKSISDGVICINYPDITYKQWIEFCTDINTVRKKAGLSDYVFTTPSNGDEITYTVFNEVITAIKGIYNKVGITVPDELKTASEHIEMTRTYFDSINDALVYIRDELYEN